MSAIIIIKNFEIFIKGFKDLQSTYNCPNLDLVIRAVLGCTYTVKKLDTSGVKLERGVKSCLIRLLNSSPVDVDKLDYITRDTFMSGYENVVLDNDRLLGGLNFIVENEVYYPAFDKSALSIIDNVISAKNAQSKWIGEHPIVKYESYLLRKAIGISFKSVFDQFFKGKNIFGCNTLDELLSKVFSSESLSKDLNLVGGLLPFSLLSDIDMLFYMKNNIHHEDVAEFFKRNERKKPIWKSLEEYEFYLPKNEDAEKVSDFLALFNHITGIEDLSHPKRINDALYDEQKANTSNPDYNELMYNLDVLKKFCADNALPFDFVILFAGNSLHGKIKGGQPFIKFKQDGYKSYKDIKNESSQNKGYMYFYVYSKAKIDAKKFLEHILNNVPSVTSSK
ncbi:MAG: hypothetical protein FWH37_09515 [Candidatus Bathyarchaeota archaeon]|nr:hypothetical protein [Candidatus Termiticorpusculum sp.]